MKIKLEIENDYGLFKANNCNEEEYLKFYDSDGEFIEAIDASDVITEEMDDLLKLPGTKVLMKSGKRLKKVRDSILRSGQNAVMIENCGMPEEKIYASAKEIPEEAGYYTLLIVKDKK